MMDWLDDAKKPELISDERLDALFEKHVEKLKEGYRGTFRPDMLHRLEFRDGARAVLEEVADEHEHLKTEIAALKKKVTSAYDDGRSIGRRSVGLMDILGL